MDASESVYMLGIKRAVDWSRWKFVVLELRCARGKYLEEKRVDERVEDGMVVILLMQTPPTPLLEACSM